MANNKIIIELQVNGNKEITLAAKQIDKTAKSVDNLKASNKKASNAAGELSYKMDQGIIGSSSAARSFSKLSQSIGHGPNGLVGAYATLAANTFAVSAAFNVLRDATKGAMLQGGLEAQGARLGITLTNVAKSVTEVTRGTIGMRDAMEATAQISSAGFGQESVIALSKAAQNASIALGRNMLDSMDRMTKGVIKLEPELLDELGVMVKLTEATNKYAAAHGKSALALTSFEKRTAFMNAVLEESNTKFGSISESVDASPYDKLAASFKNLAQSMLTAVNVAVAPFISFLADNTTALISVMVLFIGTISKELIPSLYSMSTAALAAGAAIDKKILSQKRAIATSLELAKVERESQISALKSLPSEPKAPKAYKQYVQDLRDGTEATNQQNVALKGLRGSITRHTNILATMKDVESEDYKQKALLIGRLKEYRAELERLSQAEREQAVIISTAQIKAQGLMMQSAGRYKEKAALITRASAIEAASNFDLTESYKKGSLSTALYQRSLEQVAEGKKLAATGGSKLALTMANLSGVAVTSRVALFALGTGVKALGAAMLNAIPIIGQILFVISLLAEFGPKLWHWMFPPKEGTEALKKANEELDVILERAADTAKMTREIFDSTSAGASKQAQAFLALSNSINEVYAQYDKVSEAGARLGSAAAKKGSDILKQSFKDSFGTALNKDVTDSAGFKSLASFAELGNKQLSEDINKATVESEKFNKANDAGKRKIIADTLKTLSNKYGSVGTAVQDLANSYKELETATASFIQKETISTPFDELTEKLTNTRVAILNLEAEFAKGAISSEQFGIQLTDLGSKSMGLLSANTQQALLGIQEYNVKIEAMKKLRDASGDGAQAYIYSRQVTEMEKQRNESLDRIGQLVKQDLVDQQKKMMSLQKQSIILDGVVKLEEVRFARAAKYIDGTSAGYEAQIASEKRIRDLQVAKLQSEKAVLDILNLQNRLALESTKQRKNELDLRIANIKAGKEDLNVLTRIMDTFKRLSNMALGTNYTDSLGDLEAQSKTLDASIVSLEAEASKLGNAVLSLDTQTSALLQQNLTAAEIAAQKLVIDFSNIARMGEKISEVNKNISQYETDRVKNNITFLDSYTKQFSVLSKIYANDKVNITEIAKRTKDRLGAEIQLQKAGIASGKLSSLELVAANTKLSLLEEELRLTSQQESIDQRILQGRLAMKIEELAKVDIYSKGIEIQQEALSGLQKELDIRKATLDQETEIYTLKAKIASKNAGGDGKLSAELEAAIKTEADQKAYGLALEEHNLVMAGIKAQYALLEAQRLQVLFQLEAQKTIVKALAEANGSINSEEQKSIEQIQSAVNTLKKIDYSKIQLLDEKRAKNELEIAKLKAQESSSRGGNNPYSSALSDASSMLETFSRTNSTIIENIIKEAIPKDIPVEVPDMVAAKIDSELGLDSFNTLIGSLNLNIPDLKNAVDNLTMAFNQYLVTLANSGGIAESAATSGAMTTSSSSLDERRKATIAAANWAERQPGVRVTELVGRGKGNTGGHTGIKGADVVGHDVATAFDVNMGPRGNSERTDPLVNARMDKLAEQFRAMGATVLWEVKGHFEHMHVEFLRTTSVTTADILAATTKVANAADAKIKEIKTTSAASSIPTINVPAVKATPVTSIPESVAPVISQNAEDPIVVTANKAKAATEDAKVTFDQLRQSTMTGLAPYLADLEKLGPNGELIVKVIEGADSLAAVTSESLKTISSTSASTGDKLNAMANIAQAALSTVMSVTTAASNAKIANIDKEISAEERRDGKSAASLQKLDAMNKKKDDIARKQFNLNKKLMMAQAVISTATGVAGALAIPMGAGIPLAVLIGAMGAAQLAIIAGTSYESSYKPMETSMPSTLSIGKVGNSVDLAKGPNSNAGGEVGYLRNAEGTGSNASNFRTVGSAYGGDLMRGYGNRGFTVGEKGPETISPDVPITVTPNNQTQGQNLNATINIQALDSAGVKDILVDQKGNIIKMLRDAANAQGQRFLEDVNVNVYTRPNVSKL